MKALERSIWVLLLGIVSGICFLSFTTKPSEIIPSIPYQKQHSYPLMDIALEYLNTYFIDNSQLDEKKLLFSAISGLYKATGDEYTTVFSPKVFQAITENISGTIAGIGVYLQKRGYETSIISMIPVSPAMNSGLHIGDQIISIDEIPISNFSIDEISQKIQGIEYSWVNINIFRPSTKEYKNYRIQRKTILLPSTYHQVLNKNIDYIKIAEFTDETVAEMKDIIQKLNPKNNTRGIILDLRNNPGGHLDSSLDIASMFLPVDKTIVSLTGKDNKKSQTYKTTLQPYNISDSRSLIILINENTASAAEIVAAALKDNKRGKIVGKKSFGKASVQDIFPIEYDGETFGLKITVAHYLTPANKDISHQGITPDVIVNLPNISPLIQSRLDTILDKNILEKFLGQKFEKKITSTLQSDLLEYLKKQELSVPIEILQKVINEQKHYFQGELYYVSIDHFDTQLNQAIKLLES